MKSILRGIEAVYMFVLVSLTAFVTALGVYQIAGRYLMFLHLPISWTEEMMRHLYVAIIMLGISAVERTNSFATITILGDFLAKRSPKWAKYLKIFQLTCQTIFFGLLLYYGTMLVQRTWVQKTFTTMTAIPFAIVYLSLPIGGAMGFLHAAAKLFCVIFISDERGKSE